MVINGIGLSPLCLCVHHRERQIAIPSSSSSSMTSLSVSESVLSSAACAQEKKTDGKVSMYAI